MLALSLKPLLDNTELIGLGRALKVLTAISDMSLTSVEGQAMELHWVRNGLPADAEELYVEMVRKKTAHYSFMAPLQIGAIIAGADDAQRQELRAFGLALGVAFQIQDDLLNLDPGQGYGKEQAGDLWEGKYTLALIHALSVSSLAQRETALRILAKPRPSSSSPSAPQTGTEAHPAPKSATEVAWLRQFIAEHDGSGHALTIARSWAARASECFEGMCRWFPASRHRDFIAHVVDYVVTRTR
jgi:geranylgeranyl pyrophosphate synthase